MKKAFVYGSLLFIGIGILSIFWQQELVYSLPTPVPENYEAPQTGEELALLSVPKKANPSFLHFFNPDCPCSRFNMKNFKSLVAKYEHQLDFMIIVQTDDASVTVQQIKNTFNVELPVIIDSDKKIAGTCGVYSTPQAVIIDSGKLYYRGNYNKTRYCTDKKSDYAQMAIDSLLHNQKTPRFNALATLPYGCSLPGCGSSNK